MRFTSGICACLIGFSSASLNSFGEERKAAVVTVEPDKQVTSVHAAAIDTEHFEFGPFLGLMSVEDFNTNQLSGLSLSYHISKPFLVQMNYGVSTVSRAAFEKNAGGNFLPKDAYDFKYANFLGGYDLIDGRSFLGSKHKFNSAIYLLAGVAHVEFANNSNVGFVAGLSYRTVITDWITMNLDIHDTTVKRDFLNSSKQTNNTDFTLGVNLLF